VRVIGEQEVSRAAGAWVDSTAAIFRVSDPGHQLAGVRLCQDARIPDALASLTRYLAAGVAGRWLPRMRAALLSPGPRDRWYSANTHYARALAGAVLPALARRLATSRRIGMGASLGGLAMLHLTRLVGQVCG
jgi:enterochelin esterase-like enzyme